MQAAVRVAARRHITPGPCRSYFLVHQPQPNWTTSSTLSSSLSAAAAQVGCRAGAWQARPRAGGTRGSRPRPHAWWRPRIASCQHTAAERLARSPVAWMDADQAWATPKYTRLTDAHSWFNSYARIAARLHHGHRLPTPMPQCCPCTHSHNVPLSLHTYVLHTIHMHCTSQAGGGATCTCTA